MSNGLLEINAEFYSNQSEDIQYYESEGSNFASEKCCLNSKDASQI